MHQCNNVNVKLYSLSRPTCGQTQANRSPLKNVFQPKEKIHFTCPPKNNSLNEKIKPFRTCVKKNFLY